MDVIQLNIAVTGPCRESKGLAFVLAMQSMEGFAAAAMDNAGPKCERARPTLVSSSVAQILYRSVNDDSIRLLCRSSAVYRGYGEDDSCDCAHRWRFGVKGHWSSTYRSACLLPDKK
jgi:hypothetical protein